MSDERIDLTGMDVDGVTWTMLGTLYLRAYESRSERSGALRDAPRPDPGARLPVAVPGDERPPRHAEHLPGASVHVLSRRGRPPAQRAFSRTSVALRYVANAVHAT